MPSPAVTPAPSSPLPSGAALYRYLIGIYCRASAVAVVGGAILYGFGLDLTARQILIGVGLIAPVSFVPMLLLDVLTIRAAFRPVRAFLDRAPGPADPALATAALVRAVNLPVLTALRVMLVHVPTAIGAITLLMLFLNRYMVLGLEPGQIRVLWLLTVLVGVGHAIIEHFLVAGAIRPVIPVLRHEAGDLRADQQRRLIPVGMRRTLLFVAVFMVLVPLLVLGFSVILKVEHALEGLGVRDVAAVTAPLYRWVAILTAVSMAVVLYMALMTAREVMRSVTEVTEGMRRVERDELDTRLVVTTASEFAGLYEGFNTMTRRLRELMAAHAELTALQAREHFRSLVAHASDLITVLETDGTVSYQSPSVERVLGFTPDEIVGRRAFDFVHSDDVERVADTWQRLAGEGHPAELPLEFRFRHRDGSWRILEATGRRVIDSSGRPIFVVNARDATTRKQAETALRQSVEEKTRALADLAAAQERLVRTERLRALGEMAAGVAHDFNNLLAVVLGRTEMLLAGVGSRDPAITRGLEAVRRAGLDGKQTVRRIQEFTRTRQTRPPGRVDLGEVLREVLELNRPRWKDEAQARGVRYEVAVAVEGDPLPPVAGRPEELREVFTNLLVNALEAMPGGGQFTFRVAPDPPGAVVRAEDTGCGMSEATRQRLFEPFFTTKGARGTGLGLAVSWGIVTRYGGAIEVESRPGAGSTFVVRLPPGPALLGPEAPAAAAPARRAARVLVVDDEAEVRGVLRDILAGHGYTVAEAYDGADALTRCAEGLFDLLVTDLSMPGMSGWEVAATCRDRFPWMPVGMVTGWGDQLDPQQVETARLAFVLAKPFETDAVLREVARAVEHPAPWGAAERSGPGG